MNKNHKDNGPTGRKDSHLDLSTSLPSCKETSKKYSSQVNISTFSKPATKKFTVPSVKIYKSIYSITLVDKISHNLSKELTIGQTNISSILSSNSTNWNKFWTHSKDTTSLNLVISSFIFLMWLKMILSLKKLQS